MPAPKAVLRDIADLGLDPQRPYDTIAKGGRIHPGTSPTVVNLPTVQETVVVSTPVVVPVVAPDEETSKERVEEVAAPVSLPVVDDKKASVEKPKKVDKKAMPAKAERPEPRLEQAPSSDDKVS